MSAKAKSRVWRGWAILTARGGFAKQWHELGQGVINRNTRGAVSLEFDADTDSEIVRVEIREVPRRKR